MEQTPKVSVIMPVYNRAGIIAQALKSVLRQTFTDFELIVADDGSTDDLPATLAALADGRIRLVRHDVNQGCAAGRNLGIRSACGEYVALLDSDDEWLPGKLAAQVAFLESAPPEVQACTTGYRLVQYGMDRAVIPCLSEPPLLKLSLSSDLGAGSTLMVRRSVLDEIGAFDQNLPRTEDWDWILRYITRYRIAVVPEPLAIVYKSGRANGGQIEKSALRIVEKHKDEFYSLGRFYGSRAVAKRWLEVAYYYLKEKNWKKGWQYFWKGVFINPFQRPGYYLLLIDAGLGTGFSTAAIRLKKKMGGG